MKDLEKLANECLNDLFHIGIEPGYIAGWKINTRAKRRWGQCKCIASGIYEISIASSLLQDNLSDKAAKDTIMHELLHAVKGCNGHKGKWLELANKVNRLLPQYTIKRTTSHTEKGLECAPRERNIRYVLKCTCCQREVRREKMTKVIRFPEQYRCATCGGKLIRTK